MPDASIYLDHQATTSLAPGVFEAIKSHLSDAYGNPHSSEHAYGWRASDAIERARAQIAAVIDADADEIVFTSGATEANNIALLGLDRDDTPHIITSAIEHKSVLACARERERRGSRVTILPVSARGVVDLNRLEDALKDGAGLVSIMAVNNEVGTAQPIVDIGELCHARGAVLHVDAAQALPFDACKKWAAVADIISLSSHKIGGPAGIGALHIKRHQRHRLQSLFFGGTQEDGLRPGTLPMPLCVGFASACQALPSEIEIESWRERTEVMAHLLLQKIPGSIRNGGGHGAHPGNISLTIPNGDATAVIARLQPELAVSTGSACASGIPEPSHVLRAIGLDADACDRTIRISLGRFTTIEEITAAAQLISRSIDAAR